MYRVFSGVGCGILGCFLIHQLYFLNGIDGQYISGSCKLREFRCEGGSLCLPPAEVCDGSWQCPMGDDEKICNKDALTRECQADEFKCRFGGCLNQSRACDGHFDCVGGSDEAIETCVGARPVKPRPVIPPELKSHYKLLPIKDVVKQLKNPCKFHEFRCETGGKCLKLGQVCDGKKDCDGGEDERGNDQWDCSRPTNNTKCGSEEFKCLLGGCMDRPKRCDGIPDCWGGFDEDDAFCSSTLPYTVVSSPSEEQETPLPQ